MSSIHKKTRPRVVRLRSITGVLVIIFGLLIIVGIFWGIARSFSHLHKASHNDNKPHQYATNEDTAWLTNATTKVNSPNRQSQSSTDNPVSSTQSVNSGANGNIAKSNNSVSTAMDQQAHQAYLQAMAAPISSNEIKGDNGMQLANNTNAPSPAIAQSNPENGPSHAADDPNLQGEKRTFMETSSQQSQDYLDAMVQNPVSRYEVQAGTLIPAILMTGTNSDLPGQLIAQVRSNVYDTVSGRYILIPQGAKLIGLYDSQIAYGQERVLVVWKRILFPNGQSLDLEGMPGVDMSGYAGFKDQVDNHYTKIFGSVILMSVLSAGAQLSQPQQTANNPYAAPSVNQTLAQSLGTNIANAGTMILTKNINIQPTLIIRPGYEFNVSVTKDMVFPGPYSGD